MLVSAACIGNTLGAIAGIVGPIVVAAFSEDYGGIAGWRATFFLTAGTCAVATAAWVVFQRSDTNAALNCPTAKMI